MALWRKNMQIPQSERVRKKKVRKEKNMIPLNSFYIFGTGKTLSDYIESPENRRLAGIDIREG